MATRPIAAITSRFQDSERVERRAVLMDRVPYVALIRAPNGSVDTGAPGRSFTAATYNVHRWTGQSGGARWNPDLAIDVIAELDADVIALQEVLRPFDFDDPLEKLADQLGLYVTLVSTRIHRHGELGNAILSKWPMSSIYTIDLSLSRLEQRSAIVTDFEANGSGMMSIVSTHLALVDRTRKRQVRSLLDNEQLQGPAILLGDMNAWRRCKATRALEEELTTLHHNLNWPPSFPATRPVLALDRIYARGAAVHSLRAHASVAARRASDHLPVLATIELQDA